MQLHKRSHLGQHFLSDTHYRRVFLGGIDSTTKHSQKSLRIWDMGAGSGLISSELLEQGHVVHLFEYDHRWCAYLREQFAGAIKDNRCSIIPGDMCKTWRGMSIPDCIVGNFPFDVGIPFIMQFTEQAEKLMPIHAILQKELVDRICASPHTKDYSAVSVYLQMFYRTTRRMAIPPGAFSPPPRVRCASLSLLPYEHAELFDYRAEVLTILKTGFSKRRKTLRNNFRQDKAEPCYVSDFPIDRPIALKRAEELNLDQWKTICKTMLFENSAM